jgi:hypothetical protein
VDGIAVRLHVVEKVALANLESSVQIVSEDIDV